MKIEEAIRILRLQNGELEYETQKDVSRAKKLGIEALIRVRDDRGTSYQPVWYPLPSETKEVTNEQASKT